MKKRNVITIIILVTIIITTIISFSYAYFMVSTVSDSTLGSITSSLECLDISYSESTSINMANQYPVTDEYAINNYTPLTITVTNNCTNNTNDVNYLLALTTLKDNSDNYILDNQMKILLKKQIDSNEEINSIFNEYLSNIEQVEEGIEYNLLNAELTNNTTINSYSNKTNYAIDYGKLAPGSSAVYNLYLWIDYYEGDLTHQGLNDNSTQNKQFKSTINLVLNGKEHEGYAFHESYKEFKGDDFVNTKIKLFDEENYLRNFEIGFTIDEIDDSRFRNGQVDTILDSIFEETPYPGIVFRIQNAKWFFQAGNGTTNKKLSFEKDEIQSFKIYRIDNKIYYSINGGSLVYVTDLAGIEPFDTPVTFGAGLDSNGDPMRGRFLKAIMSNMYIKFIEDSDELYKIIDKDIEKFIGVPLKETYYKKNQHTFDGTSDTGFNTNTYLFSKENYQKSFVVTFKIDEFNIKEQTQEQATLFNAKDETNSTFPGIVARRNSGNKIEISFKDGVGGSSKIGIPDTTTRLNIIKKGMDMYIQYDLNQIQPLGDSNSIAGFIEKNCFEIGATFGSNINASGIYDRVIIGKLSEMRIKQQVD